MPRHSATPSGQSHEAAPATKHDIQLLMEQMGAYYDKTEQRITALQTWTDQRLAEHEKSIKLHFDATVETVRDDLLGAKRDEMETLKDRVLHLEQHTGLAAR